MIGYLLGIFVGWWIWGRKRPDAPPPPTPQQTAAQRALQRWREPWR